MRGLRNSEDGLTIVELIVAMVVGAILAGSVNTIYTNQTYLSQNARDRALVNAYTEGRIESMRSAGYLQLSNGTTDITSELPDEINPPRSGSLVISTPSTGIKRVILTVSYNSQGKQLSETYTTYIGELGAGQ